MDSTAFTVPSSSVEMGASFSTLRMASLMFLSYSAHVPLRRWGVYVNQLYDVTVRERGEEVCVHIFDELSPTSAEYRVHLPKIHTSHTGASNMKVRVAVPVPLNRVSIKTGLRVQQAPCWSPRRLEGDAFAGRHFMLFVHRSGRQTGLGRGHAQTQVAGLGFLSRCAVLFGRADNVAPGRLQQFSTSMRSPQAVRGP